MQKGRIISNHITKYKCLVETSVYTLEISGRWKYMNLNKTDYPVVGDYVYFRETNQKEGIIERIIERRNTLSRISGSNVFSEQIIASNIDLAFICISLNKDFNIKKVLNFLSMTKSKDYESILLLTKSDLADNHDLYIDEIKKYSDIQIITVSSYNQSNIQHIKDLIKNKTAVLIGSSGVGKSTLINKILNQSYFKTNDIRESDSQGRHTTVHKELMPLDNGGYVIDSPGIRLPYSYFNEDLSEEFKDIIEIASQCKFRDCRHENEPGCKIKEALSKEELLEERYNQYLKAQKLNKHVKKQIRIKEKLQNKRKR